MHSRNSPSESSSGTNSPERHNFPESGDRSSQELALASQGRKPSTQVKRLRIKNFFTAKTDPTTMPPKQAQDQAWIAALKDRENVHKRYRRSLLNASDRSTGWKRNPIPLSPLRAELSPFENDLRLVDCSLGRKTVLSPKAPWPEKNRPMVYLQSTPRYYQGQMALEKMLTEAISFLESRDGQLARNFSDVRWVMFGPHREQLAAHLDTSPGGATTARPSTQKAEAPAPAPAKAPTPAKVPAAAVPRTSTSEAGHFIQDIRDEIYISDSEGPSSIDILILDTGFQVQRCIVQIRHQVSAQRSVSAPQTTSGKT